MSQIHLEKQNVNSFQHLFGYLNILNILKYLASQHTKIDNMSSLSSLCVFLCVRL